MRSVLSNLIASSAKADPKLFVLSGDHGYALFDEIRREAPTQFINVGVSEQAMIGYASGMGKVGLRTLVYGLSAFVPLRVLEQIKLDLCLSECPTIILGDGAGVVYTTLGASHQCAEDIAALRPLPNLSIYSPCDRYELEICFEEALKSKHPSYIRIGKSDRPVVHPSKPKHSGVHRVHRAMNSKIALVGTGSMASVAQELGKKLGLSSFSVSKLKPFTELGVLAEFQHLLVLEEHSRFGGLFSALSELISEDTQVSTKLTSFSLEDHFAHHCGGYQYALSEHHLSDENLLNRVQARILALGKSSA